MPNGQFVGETCGRGTFKNVLPTVFRMGAGGALTTLFTFAASGSQGKDSFAGLLQASDGNFYGSSSEGGSHNIGVAFRLTPSGAYTKLLDFTSTASNQYTEAFDGQLYSASSFGGTNNSGAITRTTFDGQLSIIYSFGPNIGGGNVPPYGPLVLGPDGMLYGETTYYYYQDGSSAPGSVFKTDTKEICKRSTSLTAGRSSLAPCLPSLRATDTFTSFRLPGERHPPVPLRRAAEVFTGWLRMARTPKLFTRLRAARMGARLAPSSRVVMANSTVRAGCPHPELFFSLILSRVRLQVTHFRQGYSHLIHRFCSP